MTGVETILLSALGLFLTLICAGRGFEEYQKQIREKILAKNRELLSDIDKLLEKMKSS